MPRPRRPAIELPAHVNVVRVKGRPYYYYHPGRGTKHAGKAVRLPDDPREPEFWAAYRNAAGEPEPRANPKSFANLITAYRESPEWEQLSASTKEGWSIYHRRIEAFWGDLEVRGVEAPHVCALRDKFAKQPATANATLRCLSSLLSWSIPRGWRKDNPCEHVPKLRGGDPVRGMADGDGAGCRGRTSSRSLVGRRSSALLRSTSGRLPRHAVGRDLRMAS